MAIGKPVVKRGRKQQGLVNRVRIKILPHALNVNNRRLTTLSPPSRIYARHAPRRVISATPKSGEIANPPFESPLFGIMSIRSV